MPADVPAPAQVPVPDGVGIVWDDALCEYDFGPYHPMAPIRLTLTRILAGAAGVLDRECVRTLPAPVASDEELGPAHAPARAQAGRRPSTGFEGLTAEDLDELISFGIGGDDVPPFAGMHTASARIAGGSLAAVDGIIAGHVRSAVNVAGGMHHAKPGSVSGFCVYNDAALAVRRALDAGEERVMYVDVDVHHGDGVERALWDEPRAVTLSIHETGERLFPAPASSRTPEDPPRGARRSTSRSRPAPPPTAGCGRSVRRSPPWSGR